MITASGVLSVLPRTQRIKMGPNHAGQPAHVWADEHSVHIPIDGQLVRTLPSNLSTDDIHELRLRGAVPAEPPPADPAVRNRCLPGGTAVEVDRTVNAYGTIGLGGHDLLLGVHWPANASPHAWTGTSSTSSPAVSWPRRCPHPSPSTNAASYAAPA